MTSSLDINEKSMVNEDIPEENEEILSPMPLAFYDPKRRIHVSLQPAFNQVNYGLDVYMYFY